MWETPFPTHWSLGITVDFPRGEPGLPSIWVEGQSELTWAPDGPLRCDLFIHSSRFLQSHLHPLCTWNQHDLQEVSTGLHWAPALNPSTAPVPLHWAQSRPRGMVSHSSTRVSWAPWLCYLRAVACTVPSVGNASPHPSLHPLPLRGSARAENMSLDLPVSILFQC